MWIRFSTHDEVLLLTLLCECIFMCVYMYVCASKNALTCGFVYVYKIKRTNENVCSCTICIKESGWKIPSPTVLIIVHSCNREAAASVSAKVTICSEVEFRLLGPSSISMITTKNTFLSSTTLWLWSFHFCVVVFLLKAMQR